MKLRVLADNYTYIDQYYYGEPAVSYYLEIDHCRILFDTGYSDVFIKNAELMGIDLSSLTHIILSHGHNDHTRGLMYLDKTINLKNVKMIAHPHCFYPKSDIGEDIGSPFSEAEIRSKMQYLPTEGSSAISERCLFLGQVPQSNNFENRKIIDKQKIGSQWIEDRVLDDSALVCRTREGLFIITGCSHSGICNIVEYAISVCQEERIAGILGGFHLFEVDDQLEKTIQYLESKSVKMVYPCHCVSLKAKAKMFEKLQVEEAGVGLEVEI